MENIQTKEQINNQIIKNYTGIILIGSTSSKELNKAQEDLEKCYQILQDFKKQRGEDKSLWKDEDVAGSSGKDIVKELDFMGYMSIKNGKRTIDLAPNEAYYAKNSLGLNSFLEYKQFSGKNDFLTKAIFETYKEKLEKDDELSEKFNSLISLIDSRISNLEELEQVNDYFTNEYLKLEKIWSSDLYEREALKKRVEFLGFEFDVKTKTFKEKVSKNND